MIDTIFEFCEKNAAVIAAGGVLIGVVIFIKNDLLGFFSKKPKLELSADAAQTIVGSSTPSVDEPHVIEFLRIRKAMKADLEEEFKEAAEKDKVPLFARITELERQIASPDEALLEAQKRIADLEALLDREGNEIGSERIEAAKRAMEAGDYSQADDIFAEIEAREELAVKRAARAALGRGEVAEAEIRWHDAYDHYKRAARLNETLDTLVAYARMTWRLAKGREAVDVQVKIRDLTAKEFGENSSEYATQLNNLALVLKEQGQYIEAEALFREALAIDAKTIGVEHPDYAIHLNNLAGLLRAQGQYTEAEKLYREALAIDAKTIGVEHPDYATHLNNLAGVLQAQRQFGEAETLYREALAIDEKTMGLEHPDYGRSLNNLGGVLFAQGLYEDAEKLGRQAIQIAEAALGAEHPNTIAVRKNLEILLANSNP